MLAAVQERVGIQTPLSPLAQKRQQVFEPSDAERADLSGHFPPFVCPYYEKTSAVRFFASTTMTADVTARPSPS